MSDNKSTKTRGLTLRGTPKQVMDQIDKLTQEFGEDAALSVVVEEGPNLAKTTSIIEAANRDNDEQSKRRAERSNQGSRLKTERDKKDLGRVERFRAQIAERGLNLFPHIKKDNPSKK